MSKFVCFVEECRLGHNYDATSSLEGLNVVEALFESNATDKKVAIERNERFSF